MESLCKTCEYRFAITAAMRRKSGNPDVHVPLSAAVCLVYEKHQMLINKLPANHTIVIEEGDIVVTECTHYSATSTSMKTVDDSTTTQTTTKTTQGNNE